MPLNPAEQLVADLCRRSFLSLWSEANPRASSGKELCDLLVCCAPDIVIFSVKDIALKDTGVPSVDWSRWQKKAVEDSVRQLYGAERAIASTPRVIRADGEPGVALPPLQERRIHRVAVALGSRGQVPYQQGDFGKGFAHVLDEVSLRTVLGELNTITDFVEYLAAKEALIMGTTTPIIEGNEEDLLGLFIHSGRTFPAGFDVFVVSEKIWDEVTAKPEWRARKEADQESYVWDRLIETIIELHEAPGLTRTDALDVLGGALAYMARESRFCRRVLSKAFSEFMRDAAAGRTRARIVPSPSGVSYVFLACDRNVDREHRQRELALRCFVARGRSECAGDTVVGIATERYERKAGFSLDAVRLTIVDWTDEQAQKASAISADLGYFATPVAVSASDDEFPDISIVPVVGRNEKCPCASGKKYKKCHGDPARRRK